MKLFSDDEFKEGMSLVINWFDECKWEVVWYMIFGVVGLLVVVLFVFI